MTIKTDTGLSFDNPNKGLVEIKEADLNYYTDMYEAGQTKQKLKIGREVEGNTGGNQKTLYFTKTARAGTGVVNYTGFGFTPTGYIIQAWYMSTAGGPCTSYGTRFNGILGGFYMYPGNYSNLTTRAIAIYDNTGTNRTRADFSAFISDGIALNFVDSGNDIGFTITAFK